MPLSKNERFFICRHAGKKIVFRNIIRRRKGIIEPMIQVEIQDGSECLPFIRCDKKPNLGLHLDIYNKNGRKDISHLPLRSETCEEAIDEVIGMLRQNLPSLLVKHGFADMIKELPNNWNSQLESAKVFLLDQTVQPETIIGQSGTTAMGVSFGLIIGDSNSNNQNEDDKEN